MSNPAIGVRGKGTHLDDVLQPRDVVTLGRADLLDDLVPHCRWTQRHGREINDDNTNTLVHPFLPLPPRLGDGRSLKSLLDGRSLSKSDGGGGGGGFFFFFSICDALPSDLQHTLSPTVVDDARADTTRNTRVGVAVVGSGPWDHAFF